MIKMTVAVEMGGRTVVEQVQIPGHSRKDFRAVISDIACRLELSTYGQPGPVPEMSADDMPRSFATPGPNLSGPHA